MHQPSIYGCGIIIEVLIGVLITSELRCVSKVWPHLVFLFYIASLYWFFHANFSFMKFSMLTLPNCQVSARSDFSEERYDFFFSQHFLNYGK